jgi:hypothetical protein
LACSFGLWAFPSFGCVISRVQRADADGSSQPVQATGRTGPPINFVFSPVVCMPLLLTYYFHAGFFCASFWLPNTVTGASWGWHMGSAALSLRRGPTRPLSRGLAIEIIQAIQRRDCAGQKVTLETLWRRLLQYRRFQDLRYLDTTAVRNWRHSARRRYISTDTNGTIAPA